MAWSTHKLILQLNDAVACGIRRKQHLLSSDEVVALLDQIEGSFTAATEDPDLKLEIRRAVQGFRLKILSCRDEAFEKIDSLYKRSCELGFSNLQDEGTEGIYFAQYCVRMGRIDLARDVLTSLVERSRVDTTAPAVIRKDLERDAKRGLESLPG